MKKERKSEATSNMRDKPTRYSERDVKNVYNTMRHPVLIKLNLSREQQRRSLLSQRRLGLAVNRPTSLCTMMRSYLPDDDNDLLLMSLTNHIMFERLVQSIKSEHGQIRERCEEKEEQEMVKLEKRNVNQTNSDNDSNIKQPMTNNNTNTKEQHQKVECQEQQAGHIHNSGQTKDLTELIAHANPAFYYHCEMKVLDDVRTIEEQLYKRELLPQQDKEEEYHIRQDDRTFCEADEELKVCRALARNVANNNNSVEKYDKANCKINESSEDKQHQNYQHNRMSRHDVKKDNKMVNKVTDVSSSKNSALMSKSSSASPSSGIISQSRNRWEKHLQVELQREGETVESFRQAKGQESYVSKHNFAQQVQWNEYQRELQMEYAQSEQQKKRERKRLVEEKFEM